MTTTLCTKGQDPSLVDAINAKVKEALEKGEPVKLDWTLGKPPEAVRRCELLIDAESKAFCAIARLQLALDHGESRVDVTGVALAVPSAALAIAA